MPSQSYLDPNTELLAPLQPFLPSRERPSLCNEVLPTIIHCISSIATMLRTSPRISSAGTDNTFGDEQLNVDIFAERIIRDAIAKCPSILVASSEEDPIERSCHEKVKPGDKNITEEYTLAFDPLDGSSIITPNWTVGSLIGVWDGSTALRNSPQHKQVAAILGVYGPRTTAIIAVRIPNVAPTCFEIGLGGDGSNRKCEIVRPKLQLFRPPFKTRYFAPANLRGAAESHKYMQLITDCVKEKYTLRYSGGLVPDIVHMLVKGQGVYVSPVTAMSKAKLRRLYELAPIALIIECSGGLAINSEDGKNILEQTIDKCDERSGLICGTSEEVQSVKHSLIE